MARRMMLAAFAILVVALPATAEVYTVSLHSGQTFDSLYRPQEAPWDSNKVLLRTDVGNWISVPKSDIATVTSATELGGFGTVIDNSTIELGMSAHDMPTPDELAEQAKNNPYAALQNQIQEQQPYSVKQFVDPSQTQGLPGQWVGYGNNVPQLNFPNPMAYPPPPQ